ncbi:P2X receptor [Heterostelium album PN500]|uniref:P2X receptor n=1 Tax=Heterostelium pallidum (strain ATCC 26659 / Pp 5 / PN500) TaxID=670386 RepID=D3BER7_HETP5|nr:P2X receptor [Heterostelium album PN500]EFA80398.1 P2X receptor [Heterostelium album PN500]|eukprot:XP_020432518.1 P2X receptor [Heterostelium album PN500]
MAIDWDNMLVYSTVKVVKIKDRKLSILHFLFLIAIFVYIIIYSVIVKKGYLETEVPIGSVRATLRAPSNFTYPLPYCQGQPNADPSIGFLPCQYWDENLVTYPLNDKSVSISTRVRSSVQSANCSFASPNCRYQDDPTKDENFFIGDIERYTIYIDHTMYASGSKIQKNAKSLSGRIITADDKSETLDDGISSVGIAGKPDIIELGTLLKLADINLDDQSLIDNSTTIRYDGINIFLFITYSNTFSYNLNKYRYTYSVSKIENTEYTVAESVYTTDVENRYIFKRHGIRIIFIQDGDISTFQFQALLITLVSGLGLLAIATTITDLLAIKLMPHKQTYSNFKYQETDKISNEISMNKLETQINNFVSNQIV